VAKRPPRAPRPARTPRAATLEIVPVTPARWPQLVELFGPRGACAGCWCMWPRLPSAEYRAQRPRNRQALERLVKSGDPPGLLAFENGRPVGWAAVAPRAVYRRLERSRVMAPVDDQPVWSVPCFFVAGTHRRRGVTVQLLRAACAFAAQRGARIVEGYPIDSAGSALAPTFAWHGLAATFRAAGFHEVARRSPTRPVMRKAVNPARGAAARG
jgi:GNAT superfamily N-acetyltransferase